MGIQKVYENSGGIYRLNKNYNEADDELSCGDFGEMDSGVLYIKPYPEIKFPSFENNLKAVLLEGYHSGTLNTDNRDFIRFCETAEKNKTPVYLTGDIEGFGYESKKMYEKLKINVLPPMSPIAAYIKLRLIKDTTSAFLSMGGDILK